MDRAARCDRAKGSAHRTSPAVGVRASRLPRPSRLAGRRPARVFWHTIMTQVTDRGKPLVDDPNGLAGVRAIGVDETAFLRATGRHPTIYATGIADLTAAGHRDCWTA